MLLLLGPSRHGRCVHRDTPGRGRFRVGPVTQAFDELTAGAGGRCGDENVLHHRVSGCDVQVVLAIDQGVVEAALPLDLDDLGSRVTRSRRSAQFRDQPGVELPGNERFGRPRNPDFLLKPGELLEAFGDHLEIIAYEEAEETLPTPAFKQRICARKK